MCTILAISLQFSFMIPKKGEGKGAVHESLPRRCNLRSIDHASSDLVSNFLLVHAKSQNFDVPTLHICRYVY